MENATTFKNLYTRKLSTSHELSQGGNTVRKAENEMVNLMNYNTELNEFLARNIIGKKQTLHWVAIYSSLFLKTVKIYVFSNDFSNISGGNKKKKPNKTKQKNNFQEKQKIKTEVPEKEVRTLLLKINAPS